MSGCGSVGAALFWALGKRELTAGWGDRCGRGSSGLCIQRVQRENELLVGRRSQKAALEELRPGWILKDE